MELSFNKDDMQTGFIVRVPVYKITDRVINHQIFCLKSIDLEI